MNLYSEIFQAFEKNDIRYLVVGGVAVVLHGYLRATADLDLMISLDSQNVERFITLASLLGYRPRVPVALADFSSPEKRSQWLREKGMKVFSLIHPQKLTHLLDVFVEDPIPFEEAFARRERIHTAHGDVSVACAQDLITMKARVGRPQDQEDIKALTKILESQKHG